MRLEFIVLIVVALGVLGMFLWMLFKQSGRKVYLELYEELSSGHWYRLYPDKSIKAMIFRDKDGVEKLKIPKKLSKVPLEAPNYKSLIPTSTGIPTVKLVRDAEGMFRPMDVVIVDKKIFRAKVEDREAMGWYMQEFERINKKYQATDWMTKYGPMLAIGLIIMAGLLTIWATGDKINELNDDFRASTSADTKQQKQFLVDLVNNIKDKDSNTVEASETADKPPGAATS